MLRKDVQIIAIDRCLVKRASGKVLYVEELEAKSDKNPDLRNIAEHSHAPFSRFQIIHPPMRFIDKLTFPCLKPPIKIFGGRLAGTSLITKPSRAVGTPVCVPACDGVTADRLRTGRHQGGGDEVDGFSDETYDGIYK